MPVPEGVITSTNTMSGVAPKEENEETTTEDPSSDIKDDSGQDSEDQ